MLSSSVIGRFWSKSSGILGPFGPILTRDQHTVVVLVWGSGEASRARPGWIQADFDTS